MIGSTETQFEEAEEAAFRKFALRKYREIGGGRVNDEFVSALRGYLDKRGEALRAEADGHKTAETFPARYSYFYGSVAEDFIHAVAIFKFSHINRRHALAPDGWAMMCTARLVLIDTIGDREFWEIRRDAIST